MGLTQIRFGNVKPRILSGVKSLGTGLPDGWVAVGLPATGSCSGVKNGAFLAAVFAMGAAHFALFSRAAFQPVRR